MTVTGKAASVLGPRFVIVSAQTLIFRDNLLSFA